MKEISEFSFFIKFVAHGISNEFHLEFSSDWFEFNKNLVKFIFSWIYPKQKCFGSLETRFLKLDLSKNVRYSD